MESGTSKSYRRFRKDGPKTPLAEKKKTLDPVGIRTRECQLCGISACFFSKQESASNIEIMAHLGAL